MPRFIFASDSFKGTLTSADTARLLEEAARRYYPDCECAAVEVADGGEGTVAAVVAATGGELVEAEVEGPLGEPVRACYGMTPEGEAVVEMAAASGLPLVDADKRDPLVTSTFGTGQLLLDALDRGAWGISLAIGGSATNDGGMGMLRALGVRFLDDKGAELRGCGADLGAVASVDVSGLDGRLASVPLRVMCDVDNPLLGEHGCAAVFAPQKGASPEDVRLLEEGMASFADVAAAALGEDVREVPGAGAAGGLGFACLAFLDAELVPGIQCVLDLVGFDGLIEGASLVVTGEGHSDAQTARGKVVAGVAARCREAGVPVVALVGGMDPDFPYRELGVAAVVPCVPDVMGLDEALAGAERNYALAADRLFCLLDLARSVN